MTEHRLLRILIANERKDRLERIAEIVTGLGHDVISRELEVSDVASATEREHPDLAFVGLGISGEHALDMISEIVREASCPVIALLESDDAIWVNEAAKRGIFAYIVDGRADQMQSTIEITIRRYAEYANLEGAFARRAVIERAKGIMMCQAVDRRAQGVRAVARAVAEEWSKAFRHRAGRCRQPSPARPARAHRA